MKNYYFSSIALVFAFLLTDFNLDAQCCPAGTSGVVENNFKYNATSASQSGSNVSWVNVSNGAVTNGSNATNTASGIAIGLLFATTANTVNVTVPAFSIPAGQRFCSASLDITATYVFNPTYVLFVPVGLLPYANMTYTLPAGGLTQANVTAGFTVSINAIYGFTGLGSIQLRLDGVEMTVITQTGCPLPVELLDFSGEQQEMCAALKWTTASEKNNDFFTIEKLIGHDWVEIGRVNSKQGTTQQQSDYEFVDCQASAMNYYRLSQTDRNGWKEHVGNEISVEIEMASGDDLVMFPNPAQTVTCFATEQRIKSIRVFALDGAVVGELQIPEEEQNDRVCLPVDDLVRGVYSVQVETSKGISTRKLVVQ